MITVKSFEEIKTIVECPECGSEDIYIKNNRVNCLYCKTHTHIVIEEVNPKS